MTARRDLRLTLVLLVSLATCACAATRTILASPEDYASYRAYRLSSGYGARLSTAFRYLRDQPGGDFHDESR
ncbi:MAG: hypothetical protein NVS3B20_20020 [Polyangiales bacterium]